MPIGNRFSIVSNAVQLIFLPTPDRSAIHISWHTDCHWFARYWPTLGYKVWGRTLAITLENTWPGSTTNYDQDSLAAVSQHMRNISSGCFLPATFSPLVFAFLSAVGGPEWSHLGWSLSPTGLSKTVPADGAFTSCLAIYTLWKMTIRHLLLSKIPTHRRDACCVHPI